MNGPELNEAISNARGFKYNGRGMMVREHFTQTICDYYNNWNDLMPIVLKYKICLDWDDELKVWDAIREKRDEFDFYFEFSNKIPERAYCECLLAVLTEGKSK